MAGKGRGGGSDEGKAEKKEVFHYDLMTGDKLYFIWWLLQEPFFSLSFPCLNPSVRHSEVFFSEDNAKAFDWTGHFLAIAVIRR